MAHILPLQDVTSLRESLEPQLAALTAEQFERLRNTEWAERPCYAPGGLLAAQSTQVGAQRAMCARDWPVWK